MKNTLSILFSLFAFTIVAQTPTLVTDFNPGADDAFDTYNNGIVIGDALVFPLTKAGCGEELGVIRNGNLSLLKEINTGAQGSEPQEFTRFNDVLIFAAFDNQNDWTIWQTDGTEAGTVMIHDPGTLESSRPRGFTVANSGLLYYTYSSTLYAYDGSAHTEVFSGVFFTTDFNSQNNRYSKYQNEVAFLLENDNDEIELYAIENGAAQLLGKTGETSGFASFYGLMEINGGLIFSVEDFFANENEATYFYSASSETLNSFEIDGAVQACRRLIPYSNEQALAMVIDKGYLLLNGEDNQEEIAYNSPDVGIGSGTNINSVIYEDNIIFDVDEGFSGNNYIVYKDGSSSSANTLFEINFLSNILAAGKYAFVAEGTSNGFEPELYQIDMSDGSFENIYSFNQPSNQINSVLLLGVLDDKLYMANKLDASVGRELYVMDVNLVNSIQPIAEPAFEVQLTSESFQILSDSHSRARVNIYDASGRLLQTLETNAQTWVDISHLQGVNILEVVMDGQRLSRKFIGR